MQKVIDTMSSFAEAALAVQANPCPHRRAATLRPGSVQALAGRYAR
jgi:hypothetical protein